MKRRSVQLLTFHQMVSLGKGWGVCSVWRAWFFVTIYFTYLGIGKNYSLRADVFEQSVYLKPVVNVCGTMVLAFHLNSVDNNSIFREVFGEYLNNVINMKHLEHTDT